VVIYTEGKNTEPGYVRSFAAEHGNSLVTVECFAGAGVPATLVAKAREELARIKRSRDGFATADQVWVIFDEDEHPLVQQSINLARQQGIKVGYSNPCFEIWLLLHFADHDAPDGRHAVQAKLAQADDGYDANGAKEPTYAKLRDGFADARERAIRMRQRRKNEGQPRGCPFTDVDLLLNVIIDNGKIKAQA
jgi:hypothetical protein